MKNTISTIQPIFLVEFLGVKETFLFCGNESLGDLIQKHGRNHGIICIKQFVQADHSFRQMKQEDVKMWFDYDTHTMEQLKKINFI